jgi:hypothetical protein
MAKQHWERNQPQLIGPHSIEDYVPDPGVAGPLGATVDRLP